MAATGGRGQARSQRDKEMAARLKREGVERTTGRCPNCYRIVPSDSSRSRNTHIAVCDGGGRRG